MSTGGAQAIYVCIVADAEAIIAARADAARDVAAKPVKISAGIMATTTAQTRGQGSAALTLTARAGNLLRFYATSGSYDFESAALITAIHTDGRHSLLQDFELVDLQQVAVTPVPNDPGVAADAPPTQDFWFWQCTTAGEGTQHCHIVLALYDRDDDGEPRFAGTYRWDLALTVKFDETPPDNDM